MFFLCRPLLNNKNSILGIFLVGRSAGEVVGTLAIVVVSRESVQVYHMV